MRALRPSLVLLTASLAAAIAVVGCPSPPEPDDGPGLDERPKNETCVAPDRPVRETSVQLVEAFPNLAFANPVMMLEGPNGRLYVVEKAGRVFSFDDDPGSTERALVVDITAIVNDNFDEAGLLGMAFSPEFEADGTVYLSYTTGNLRSVVARFISTDGGLTINEQPEELLSIAQPFANHNGGGIAFGPDGHLYAGFGDGGAANDPQNHGQNTDTLLGTMLRIDVSPPAGFLIPEDNPFADGGGAPEIFAWGLRNPWRFSFDRESGELWVGDVGQNAWEEIDLVELGGNYGWKLTEGKHCRGSRVATCEELGGLIPPIVEYNNDLEGKSVTGGYVYRGSAIPELVGTYIYADFTYGTVWGLFFDPITGEPAPEVLLDSGRFISSFAEDAEGEIYVIAYNQNGGRILRFEPVGNVAPDTFPKLLSETGCTDPDDVTKPASGLIPYEVNVPFWSDGADKGRFLALPDGEVITSDEDGALDIPTGSVIVKDFVLDGDRIETRLLVRHNDGEWAGYTYAWRADGSDADLLPAALARDVGGQTWTYPSRPQCLACHTEAAGRTLGLHLDQLDRDATYASTGRTASQLETWKHIEILDEDAANNALVDPFGNASLDARARSYLAVNCAHCHLPGGTGQGELDLRHTVSFEEMSVCDQDPQEGDLGLADSKLLVPGDASKSLLYLRTIAEDANRMPDISRGLVDTEGSDLIKAWIESIDACD